MTRFLLTSTNAAMLLMAQPDFGTAVVLLATALGMLFLGGAPLWQFALLVCGAASAQSHKIAYVDMMRAFTEVEEVRKGLKELERFKNAQLATVAYLID